MLKLQWQRSGNAVALQPKRSVVDNAVDNAVAYAALFFKSYDKISTFRACNFRAIFHKNLARPPS